MASASASSSRLPSPTPAEMESERAKEQAFLAWFGANGGEVSSKIELCDFSSEGMGRGARATEQIEEDELLFAIPRSLLLTTWTAELPKLVEQDAQAKKAWDGLRGWSPLILSMMHASLSGTSSIFAPYLALMPAQGSFNSLMFWSATELDDLKGSKVLGKIGKDDSDTEWETVLQPMVESYPSIFGPSQHYTLELFHHMGSLILSRSFHVEAPPKSHKANGTTNGKGKSNGTENGNGVDHDGDSEMTEEEGSEAEDEQATERGSGSSDSDDEEEDDGVDTVAMVPFADLLNARSGVDNARLFYEPQCLEMRSTRPISPGEQVWNTYGEPPNADLLRRYGHVDPGADGEEQDVVEVGLDDVLLALASTEVETTQLRQRAEWLLDQGIDDMFTLDRSLEMPEELLSAVRTLLLSPADWEKAQKKERVPSPKLKKPEAAALIKVVKRREGEYKTTLEEDDELLRVLEKEQKTVGRLGRARGRLYAAVVVRRGEKKVLRDARAELELI